MAAPLTPPQALWKRNFAKPKVREATANHIARARPPGDLRAGDQSLTFSPSASRGAKDASRELHDEAIALRVCPLAARRGVFTVLLLLPVLYPLVVSFLYVERDAIERPALAVDEDNSALSRELLLHLDATQGIQIVGLCRESSKAALGATGGTSNKRPCATHQGREAGRSPRTGPPRLAA